MRLAFFLLVFSILYGCVPNQCLSVAATAEINVYHISLLERGMNQVEVLKVMRHPYSDQVFYLDEDIYDVWFYVTTNVVLGQSRMMPANLTPLAFKNGRLIGWGNSYYNTIKSRELEAERAKLPPPPAPPKTQRKDVEDKELEKSLQKAFQPDAQTPRERPKPSSPRITPHPSKKGQNQKKGQSQPNAPNWSPLEEQEQQQPTQPQPKGSAPHGGSEQKKNQKKKQDPNAPDWSPLEKQQPPPPPQGQQSSQLSMSRKEGSQDEQGKEPKNTRENRVPLSEEDEEMLRQEREYDFDQT